MNKLDEKEGIMNMGKGSCEGHERRSAEEYVQLYNQYFKPQNQNDSLQTGVYNKVELVDSSIQVVATTNTGF